MVKKNEQRMHDNPPTNPETESSKDESKVMTKKADSRIKSDSRKKSRRCAGFSLIELLVVVCILLIIAGIAIPRLLAARTASVETAAGSTMRSVNTALMGYNARFGVWPAALANLGGTNCDTAAQTLAAGCFLDNGLATTLSTGVGQYIYTYTTTNSAITLNADPMATSSAKRHFYSDSNLVLHYNDAAAASATDPTIGN
jgi:prepilin-type N-terminal cleavage/methylation domain-containing protein